MTRSRVLSLVVALVAVVALAAAARQAPARPTAVRFGALVDGLGYSTRDAVVIIEGDRITRVGSGNGARAKDADVIDLRRSPACRD